MGQLIVTVASTLDGYAAGPDGDVFAMPVDLGFDRYNLTRMRAAHSMLFGASTFRGARDYWPRQGEDLSAPTVEQEIAGLYRTLDKVVVSDTLTAQDTDPWRESTEVVRRTHSHDRVAELKTRGDVVCFGSLTTWNDLLEHGLVDEVHLLVGPGILGSGLPTFGRLPARGLTLLDARQVDDSQLVALRYAVGG